MDNESISITLYNIEKQWIEDVKKIFIDYIPTIQAVIPKMKEYGFENKLEYGGCDRYAWTSGECLVLQTQNFLFIICDDMEFSVKYSVLDEYTREHCRRMYSIKASGYFIQIYKDLPGDNKIVEIGYNNYKFFEYFIGEIESLIQVIG